MGWPRGKAARLRIQCEVVCAAWSPCVAVGRYVGVVVSVWACSCRRWAKAPTTPTSMCSAKPATSEYTCCVKCSGLSALCAICHGAVTQLVLCRGVM